MTDTNNESNVNNNEQQNNNANQPDPQKEFLDVVAKLEAHKESEFYKNYMAEKNKGIVSNRDALLKENKELKALKNKIQKDEFAKLYSSGKKDEAIQLLLSEHLKPHQDLIAEKDEKIRLYEEEKAQLLKEKDQVVLNKIYKDSAIYANVDESATDDVLELIHKNFVVKEGKAEYTGKEINSKGKPLNLEEFLIKTLKAKTYFLKDRSGSGTIFKTSTENNNGKKEKETFEEFKQRKQAEEQAKKAKK